ncbi:OmpA family protein [Paracoccus sp. (in: a-proteobacteria)]|uniref:OmpA family protein n=1 Tax=Paracoccus sp. TaxID=267 RepID=UPI0026DFFFDD|nr:OmpA family protein [Paracoccus sp. (in: a-proteobacteria)]MDO5369211.1 OmpA family protein [Paracoccus sp. (in: a-proteobacteria)]
MIRRVHLLIASVGVMALGACAQDPYGQFGNMSRTQQGIIAGAATGAVLGAVRDDDSNNRGRDIARGAIAGGAAGGLIGSVLDAQARALQQQMTTPGVQVVNTGQTLNVTLPEGVLFAFDSAAVSGPAQNDLYALARNLQQYPNSTVQVIGHTDSTGAAAYNMDLSQRRARSVASILTAGGVSPNRIATQGMGMNQPIASNATEAGRAQNRRVEIIIRPNR